MGVFGRTVAWWLHRWINPQLASEQKEMNIREKKHGIVVNRQLPVLERRYLHSLFEYNSSSKNKFYDGRDRNSSSLFSPSLSPASALTKEELESLYRWRESTKIARRVESGDEVSKKLVELETALIVEKNDISHEHLETALYYDWDIDSLQEWLSKRKYYDDNNHEHQQHASPSSLPLTPAGISKTITVNDTVWYARPVAFMMLMICLIILINLMMHWIKETSYDITYRTMAYSMLFAPTGALLRWKLSGWNGKLGTQILPIRRMQRWRWLPIGTLVANVVAAMVSITMVGFEYNLGPAGKNNGSGFLANDEFWIVATFRAIKIGFCGCLSTVSTFVSEVYRLTQIRQDRGYKYIVISLVLSATLSMILFVIIV